MKVWEKITIIFWLLIAFVICFESSKLDMGSFAQPGAGFLPFLLGLLLGVLSLFLMMKNRIEAGSAKRGKDLGEFFRWKKVFWALGALLFYALFLNFLGFILVTFLTLLFLYKKMGDNRWRFAFCASFLTIGFCYVVFQLWLSANLPKGVLGF